MVTTTQIALLGAFHQVESEETDRTNRVNRQDEP